MQPAEMRGDAGPAGSLAPWLAGSAILDSTVSRTGAHGAHGSSETHRVRFNMFVASLRFAVPWRMHTAARCICVLRFVC